MIFLENYTVYEHAVFTILTSGNMLQPLTVKPQPSRKRCFYVEIYHENFKAQLKDNYDLHKGALF